MAVLFGGFECLDPKLLYEQCVDAGHPTDWFGKANKFTGITVGLKPGHGHLLMLGRDLDKLDSRQRFTLQFSGTTDGANPSTLPLPNVRIIGQPQAILAGHTNSHADTAYLVDIADRRADCTGIANRRFNWRYYPTGGFVQNSTNAGTAYTWIEVLTSIWNAVGNLGTWPGLPITLTSTPEQIDGHACNAADLLEDLLYLHGLGINYHLKNDVFSIIDLSYITQEFLNVHNQLGDAILNQAPYEQSAAFKVPQYIRVCFPVWSSVAADLDADALVVRDIAITPYGNTQVPGSYILVQSPTPARVLETAAIDNGANLSLHAADIASAIQNRWKNALNINSLYQTFSGILTQDQLLKGGVDAIVWQDIGNWDSANGSHPLSGLTTTLIRSGVQGVAALYSMAAGPYTSAATGVAGTFFGSPTLHVANNDRFVIAREGGDQSELTRFYWAWGNRGELFPNSVETNTSGLFDGLIGRRSILRHHDMLTAGSGRDWFKWWHQKKPEAITREIRVTSTTTTSGRYPGKEIKFDVTAGTYSDGDDVWVVDINSRSLAIEGYTGTLTDSANSRQVYQVNSAASSIKDWHYWRAKVYGATDFYSSNSYLPCDIMSGNNYEIVPSTEMDATGSMYAMPFIVPHGGTLNTIAMYILLGATTGGSNARWGIYERDVTTYTNFMYPGALLSDLGTFSTSTPGNPTALGGAGVVLDPGKVYFAVVRFDNSANAIPTTYGHRNTGTSPTQYAGLSSTRIQQYDAQNLNNTTLTALVGGANFLLKSSYYFEMTLMVGLASSTDGIQIDFNGGTGTGGGSTFIAYTEIMDDTTGLVVKTYTSAFNTAISSVLTSNNVFIRSTGHFTNASDYTTFVPRASKVLNIGGTSTIVTGSKIIIHENQPSSVNSWIIHPYAGGTSLGIATRNAILGYRANNLGSLAALPNPFPTSNVIACRMSDTAMPRLFFQLTKQDL